MIRPHYLTDRRTCTGTERSLRETFRSSFTRSITHITVRTHVRRNIVKIIYSAGRNNRNSRKRSFETAPFFFKELHRSSSGVKAESAAAAQHYAVNGIHCLRLSKERCLSGARSRPSDIDTAYRAFFRKDSRYPRRPAGVGRISYKYAFDISYRSGILNHKLILPPAFECSFHGPFYIIVSVAFGYKISDHLLTRLLNVIISVSERKLFNPFNHRAVRID